eukprot:gene5935-6174_t
MKLVQSEDVPWTGVSHDPDVKKRVLLRYGDIPNITQLARGVLQPGQISSRHKHSDMNEVFFVEGGEVVLYLETPKQPEVQRIVLKAGSCLTVQLEEWHEIRNESDQPAYLLYFGVLSASLQEGR